MFKLNILQNSYLVQPYAVGKDKRSLAMIVPSEVVKSLKINPLTIFLLLKIKGIDDIHLKIIREEDLVKKETIPANKVPSLGQQASMLSGGK